MPKEYSVCNQKWVCMRPNRTSSLLEFSIQQHGLQNSGSKLFDSNPFRAYRDSNGHIWVSDLLNEEALFKKAISNPQWFYRKAKLRNTCFINIQVELLRIQNKIKSYTNNSQPDYRTIFYMLCQLAEHFYTFVQLGFIDDLAIEILLKQVNLTLPPTHALSFVIDHLNSTYAKQFTNMKLLMHESKEISLNQTSYISVINGLINFDVLNFEDMHLIENSLSANERTYFKDLAKITFIAYQLGQQNLFVGKPLLSTISYVLSQIYIILNKKNHLCEDDLFNLQSQEILSML